MTTNVIRVNGDYKVQVAEGGSITFDTGSDTGNFTINGNLTVTGNTTTVNTTNLEIEDNTIVLNLGETGDGVSEDTAGIVIKRGTNTRGDAQIIWDETLTWDSPVDASPHNGLFVFKTATGGINGIRTNSINTNGGDLWLINDGTGVISVAGTINYEDQVQAALDEGDGDIIPNSQWVSDFVQYQLTAYSLNNIVTPPTTSIGQAGDTAGSFAADGTNFYYCIANYNGGNIWVKTAWTSTGSWS